MHDNDWLVLSIVMIFCIVVFGGHLGIAISNPPDLTASVSTEKPNIFDVFEWIWDGISFFFAIIAFQVPDVPEMISIIYILILLMPVFILLKFVRGSNGT